MTLYFLTNPHDSADEPTMASMRETDFAEIEALIAAVGAFNAKLEKAGAFRFAGGLQPPSTAKTIDPTGDRTVVRDEPFTVADKYVGGFWIIEAADEAEALRWATEAAEVLGGPIELRAFQEAPES